MNLNNKDKVLYWVFTAPIMGIMLASGIGYFSGAQAMLEGMAALGYPAYLLKILGFFKVTGAVAVLWGRWCTLKEWAYAGFTFNLLGASASHLFVGDPIVKVIVPFVFLGVLLASRHYWKKSDPHACAKS